VFLVGDGAADAHADDDLIELRQRKPIVATRLLTHTQVLSDDTAILTAASPQEFAAGILQA